MTTEAIEKFCSSETNNQTSTQRAIENIQPDIENNQNTSRYE